MVYVIALDVGTSSMRAVLYNEQGALMHAVSREYHTVFPKPSHVEQDPKTWSQTAEETLSGVAEYAKSRGISISAISVTSQRASLIPMDAQGQPLHPAIMWQDKRTIGICDRLARDYGVPALHERTGLRINPFFVLNKIIWLKENEPDLFARTQRFIGVQDYVIYHLTGQYVTDWTQASRTMLMDLKTFRWDESLLKIASIREDQLCELVPPGSVAGGLRARLARRCGLNVSLPVIVSGGDQQNAAIALGVTRPGMAEANTGTGSFLLSFASKPVFDAKNRVLCQAAAIAGSYVTETPIFNTGAILRWFREQFCPDLRQLPNPYALMTAEAEQVAPGSNGVLLMPHFEGAAAPNWDPHAKGLFFNLGLATTRGMMIRAIYEGIAMEIAANLDLMRDLTGTIDAVHVAGGMTRADLFCSIQASAYNTRVIRHENPEASSLGACCNALVSLKVIPSADAFFRRMAASQDAFDPEPESVGIYRRIGAKRQMLYQALAQSDVYEAFMGSV
ncbi:MAG: carbohydrate kinase [Clostridiaceae bacterium]|nr:FGGY family carbohydrate kinase [Clostridiales bacterium]MDD2441392.1 FGGY family carbohydrate kinase [Eubacteriales bacterium]MDD4138851.1 FGGY family carbohydrate kinase [Eubacteriales bacterium]MDD4743816.1 FGGY family carbohydrate kinase [Eubacteriales bacterium]NLB44394.1 carbohydrate kinase [Clostridiaceae bacterium]